MHYELECLLIHFITEIGYFVYYPFSIWQIIKDENKYLIHLDDLMSAMDNYKVQFITNLVKYREKIYSLLVNESF